MPHPRAADNFVSIRARMEELRRERAQGLADDASGWRTLRRLVPGRRLQTGRGYHPLSGRCSKSGRLREQPRPRAYRQGAARDGDGSRSCA